MLLAVCLSFTDHRPAVDALTGEVSTDDRSSGLSAADAAALELALCCAERWRGGDPVQVLAVTVGPPAADAVLRDALAAGADRAVRVHVAAPRRADAVADALAAVLGDATLVWCGDQGLDAGSGAVPAFLAAALGVAGAFGLVDVAIPDTATGPLVVLRRLDGGRRERLRVLGPAVLSVEGATTRLRRAPLPAVLRAGRATIDVRPARVAVFPPVRAGVPAPYRPRPRVQPGPAGDTALERVRSLTGAGLASATSGSGRSQAARAVEPREAAALILQTLADWGYELPERSIP